MEEDKKQGGLGAKSRIKARERGQEGKANAGSIPGSPKVNGSTESMMPSAPWRMDCAEQL